MKNCCFRIIALVAVAVFALPMWAVTEHHDTIYFYCTWEQVLYQEPEAMIVDPIVTAYTPFEIAIETHDNKLDNMILNDHVAATLGDSIWLISSAYLKHNFGGDARKLSEFVPLFFNDKVAYALYSGANSVSLKDVLFGDDGDYENKADYYYIDFETRKVVKVTHTTLSGLLGDYHDLQMRYEGMKDYKKRPIIEDYFFKFIDRATRDPMRPYILDLVGTDSALIQ